jgi:hypothetical protein
VFYRALRADERTTRARVVTDWRLPSSHVELGSASARLALSVRARRERDTLTLGGKTGVPYSEPDEVFVKTAMIPVS